MKYLKCVVRKISFPAVLALCVLSAWPAARLCAEQLFMTSSECAFCHTAGNGALIDSAGNDLSIVRDWSSSMMANAFRDPLFRAKLESEKKRNPALSAAIDDKCLTCHVPMAITQSRWEGNKSFSVADAEQNELAGDGVSCTLCHQIQPAGLGGEKSFSGGYVIDDRREIYGPYKNIMAQPMVNHTGYMPRYGSHVGQSELCATCHTLFTPYFNEDGTVAGSFPEQTPYLEWLNSDYSSGEQARSCQDCHMPKVEEYVKITNRPPWYQGAHTPFWKHHFVGGNSLIVEMLAANPQKPGTGADRYQFDVTLARIEQQLQQRTAELTAVLVDHGEDQLRLDVSVANTTGHKFPTGFPSRRAWLRVQLTSGQDSVFDSGNWHGLGEIDGENDRFEPHYDVITDDRQVQIYQAVMADQKGAVTTTLLEAASYAKDNRLVPAGFVQSGPMTEVTGPVGAVLGDDDFNRAGGLEGTGEDTVSYEIALHGAKPPFTARVSLLYQTVSPGFVADLAADDTPAARRFAEMFRQQKNPPMVIDSIEMEIN